MDEKISITFSVAKEAQSQNNAKNSDKTKILLQGYNNKDGIGDFEHLIDFFHLCETNFPDSAEANNIQAVAYVDKAKLNLAQNILPHSLSARTYIWDINEALDIGKAKTASLIVVSGWTDKDNNKKVVVDSASALHNANVLLTPNLFMNISMPLKNIDGGLVNHLSDDCLKYSILEYNAKPEFYKTDKVYVHEIPMGFSSAYQQIGIKFNQEIADLRSMTLPSKMNALLLLKNKKLMKSLIGMDANIEIPDFDESRDFIIPPARILAEQRASFYLRYVPFAMGYLQDVTDTHLFVKTLTGRYSAREFVNKPQLDIMVNKNFIDTVIKETDISTIAAIKKLLEGSKYTSLVILDNDGKVLISYPKGVDTTQTNTLRLIKFNGIDNNDKITLSGMAEAMSGSGDNSFSAVASADVFPYLGMPYWKSGFVALLKQISHQLGAPELTQFMDLNYQITMAKQDKNENIGKYTQLYDSFIAYASQHYEKIKNQWTVLSSILANNHDVKHYFHEIRANEEINQLITYAGKKENQVDEAVILTNIKQFASLIAGMFIRGIPINLEIIKSLNEDIKDIVFNSCCLHSSEIVGRQKQCQQHVDLLLYAAIMKKDKTLCYKALQAGAQLILDPHVLNCLHEDGLNSLHMLDIKQTTDKIILDMLLHKFPHKALQALKMENNSKEVPLQAHRANLSLPPLDNSVREGVMNYLADRGISFYKIGSDEKLPVAQNAVLISCKSLKETAALNAIIEEFNLRSPKDYMHVDGHSVVAIKDAGFKQITQDLLNFNAFQKSISLK